MIVIRRSICRTMTSMCLSWIDTPCCGTPLDLVHEVLLGLANTEDAQHLLAGRAHPGSAAADLDVLTVLDEQTGPLG
jgi:hypothetical protein